MDLWLIVMLSYLKILIVSLLMLVYLFYVKVFMYLGELINFYMVLYLNNFVLLIINLKKNLIFFFENM